MSQAFTFETKELLEIIWAQIDFLDNCSSQVGELISQAGGMSSSLQRAMDESLNEQRNLLRKITGQLNQFLTSIIEHENKLIHLWTPHKLEAANARARHDQFLSQLETKKVESCVQSFHQLVFDANSHFAEFKRTIERAGNIMKKRDISLVKEISASIKQMNRAFIKAFIVYKGKDSFRKLTDMLRASFVFDSFDGLYEAVHILAEVWADHGGILRIKDRFAIETAPFGYRDLLLNVYAPGSQIVCEIQLHHLVMYNNKAGSHTIYKQTRVFNTGTGNRVLEFAQVNVRPVIGNDKEPDDGEEGKSDTFDKILSEHGLGEFVDVFARNGWNDPADWTSVRRLDLEEMGLRQGHLRKWDRITQCLVDSENEFKRLDRSASPGQVNESNDCSRETSWMTSGMGEIRDGTKGEWVDVRKCLAEDESLDKGYKSVTPKPAPGHQMKGDGSNVKFEGECDCLHGIQFTTGSTTFVSHFLSPSSAILKETREGEGHRVEATGNFSDAFCALMTGTTANGKMRSHFGLILEQQRSWAIDGISRKCLLIHHMGNRVELGVGCRQCVEKRVGGVYGPSVPNPQIRTHVMGRSRVALCRFLGKETLGRNISYAYSPKYSKHEKDGFYEWQETNCLRIVFDLLFFLMLSWETASKYVIDITRTGGFTGTFESSVVDVEDSQNWLSIVQGLAVENMEFVKNLHSFYMDIKNCSSAPECNKVAQLMDAQYQLELGMIILGLPDKSFPVASSNVHWKKNCALSLFNDDLRLASYKDADFGEKETPLGVKCPPVSFVNQLKEFAAIKAKDAPTAMEGEPVIDLGATKCVEYDIGISSKRVLTVKTHEDTASRHMQNKTGLDELKHGSSQTKCKDFPCVSLGKSEGPSVSPRDKRECRVDYSQMCGDASTETRAELNAEKEGLEDGQDLGLKKDGHETVLFFAFLFVLLGFVLSSKNVLHRLI